MKRFIDKSVVPEAAAYLAICFHLQGYALYAVGGWVRDQLLGRTCGDMDLSGDAPPDAVRALFEGDDRVDVLPRSLPMGTLVIRVDDGALEVEYTCFRCESYRRDGSHRPMAVRFPVTLEQDALRRDFSINAIYYDLIDLQIVDPVGGIDDLGQCLLRTVREPREVFVEDALRILRLCRQAAELDACVDLGTQQTATELSHLIENLSNERIAEELKKLLGSSGNLQKGLLLLLDTGTACVIDAGLDRQAMDKCVRAPQSSTLRWTALLSAMDIAKAKALAKRLCLGGEMISDILFVLGHQRLDIVDIRYFMVRSGFRRTALLLDYLEHVERRDVARYRALLTQMMEEGVVDSVNELALDGQEIMDILGIDPSPAIGRIKEQLLRHVAYHPQDNTPQRLKSLLLSGNLR